jgi:hypothetical protein
MLFSNIDIAFVARISVSKGRWLDIFDYNKLN